MSKKNDLCAYSSTILVCVLSRKTNEQSSTNENETPKITLDKLEKQSRKFNIDLAPKVRTKKVKSSVIDFV